MELCRINDKRCALLALQSEHVINVNPEDGEEGGGAFMAEFFEDVRGPNSVPVIVMHVGPSRTPSLSVSRVACS
jgi:hypothetical protein